jgi:hypothetical protein
VTTGDPWKNKYQAVVTLVFLGGKYPAVVTFVVLVLVEHPAIVT